MNLKQLQKKYNLIAIELYTQKISEYKISFTANSLKQTELIHRAGKAIRLLNNKQIGFVANYGDSDLEEAVLNAIELSKYSSSIEVDFPTNKQQESNLNSNLNQINPNDLFSSIKSKCTQIIETILNTASQALVDVSFDVSNHYESIENTNELFYSHLNNVYSLSINLRETNENDFIEIFTCIVDKNCPDYSPYIHEVIEYYKLCKKQAKIKTGSYPILFTSKAAKELLNIIELALNGKQVNEKSSPWHDKTGKKVLSNNITIVQDPTFGYMARELDDEGYKTQPLSLIRNGVLENFYWDLLSSIKTHDIHKSTGNGFKPSLTSQPEPTLLNMIVAPGSKSLNEIIKNIKYGLLIDQTMGGLTSNISGDISLNVDIGFLIENGELIGRVKDTMVSGNIYTALNNVIELSNESKFYWSNTYNPDMLLDSFMITTK